MVMNILRRQGAPAPTPVITLSGQTLVSTATSPATAYCAITFGTDGGVIVSADSGSHPNWLQYGAASDYQIRAVTTTGTLSVGTAGTWLNFPVTFAVSQTTTGTKTWTGTFEIQQISGPLSVAGPTNFSLTATVYASGTSGGGTGGTDYPPGGVFGGGGGAGRNEN